MTGSAPTERGGWGRRALASWPYALLVLLGVCVFLPNLGDYGLWDPWEPRYVQSVREMVDRGDYFIPYYRDEVRLAKPILTYWSVLCGTRLFGLNEFGARIGGVCAAIVCLLAVCYAVSRLRGRAAGLLSAAILGTCPQFYFLARQATPDIFFSASLGLSILFLCLGFFGRAEHRKLHFGVGYLCIALAVLSKGPVLVAAILLLTLAVYAVARFVPGRLLGGAGARSALLSEIRPLLGPAWRQGLLFALVFVAVAGPWHVAVAAKLGNAFFTEFIVRHNLLRSVEVINRSGISDYYFRFLIFGLFPWSCFLPIAATSLIHWRDDEAVKRQGPELFLLIACTVTFVGFSVAATKFSHYLSALLVPAAVLIALTLLGPLERKESRWTRLLWIGAALFYLLPMSDFFRTANGARYLFQSFTVKYEIPERLAPDFVFAGIVVFIALVLLVSIFLRSRVLVAGLVLAAALLGNYLSGELLPALTPHKSMKPYVELWKEYRQDDAPLGLYGKMKHSIVYYTNNEFVPVRNEAEFDRLMDSRDRAFCVVPKQDLSELLQRHGERIHVVDDTHHRFALLANEPVP